MRAALTLSLAASACAAGAGTPAGSRPGAPRAGEVAAPARGAADDAPRPQRPPPRWWTRGGEACPDGGHLERDERDDGRVLTCKTGAFPHGPEVAWYESGVRRWERTFLDGELHGVWVRWFPSGKKRSEVDYVHGERHGLSRAWEKDGEIVSRSRWRRGQLRARTDYRKGQILRTVRYHPNGQRASEHAYKNGARHGPATTWHPSGAVASRGEYRQGKKHGTWVYGDERGRVIRSEDYEEGELTSRREGGEMKDGVPADLRVGIDECDAAVGAVLACEKLPEANRAAARKAATRWRESLEGDGEGRDAKVRRSCEQAGQAWKQALEAAGC